MIGSVVESNPYPIFGIGVHPGSHGDEPHRCAGLVEVKTSKIDKTVGWASTQLKKLSESMIRS